MSTEASCGTFMIPLGCGSRGQVEGHKDHRGLGRLPRGDTGCAAEEREGDGQCVRKVQAGLATLVTENVRCALCGQGSYCAWRTETHLGPKIRDGCFIAHPQRISSRSWGGMRDGGSLCLGELRLVYERVRTQSLVSVHQAFIEMGIKTTFFTER